MTVSRRKSLKWFIYAAVMVIAAVTAAFLILSYKYTGDTIRKGISIEQTDVSWLTSEAAKNRVTEELKRYYDTDKLTLTYKESKWDIRLSDIDYSFKVDDAVEKAFTSEGKAIFSESSLIHCHYREMD